MGGFIVRKLQDSYPEKTFGLVLVNPSHENLIENILATKTKEEAEIMTKKIDTFYTNQPIAIQNEFKEIIITEKEMKTIDFSRRLPITI